MVLRRRARHVHGRALRAAGSVLAVGGLASLGWAVALPAAAPAGASTSSTSTGSGFGDPTGQPLAYVTESGQNAVAVIETQPLTSPKVLGTIPVPAAPTACAPPSASAAVASDACPSHPVGITASPTGQWIYVDASAGGGTNEAGTPMGAVDVLSVATDTVTVLHTTSAPESSAISPSGTTLYVAAQGGANTTSGVLDVIHVDGSTLSGLTAVPLPTFQFVTPTAPEAVAVGDHGARVAVVGYGADDIGYLDIFTATPGTGAVTPNPKSLRFSVPATSVTVDPTGTRVAYAVPEATTSAGMGPVDTHAVTVVTLVTFTTATKTPPKVVTLATGFATAIAASPLGTTLAVALTKLTHGSDAAVAPLTITKSKPATPTPAKLVPLAATAHPTAVQFLPSGTGLYVVDETATSVSVLDTITRVVGTAKLSTPSHLTGIKPLAVAFGHVTPPAPATTTTTTSSTTTTTTTTVPTTVTVPVKTSGGSSTSSPPPATGATAATGSPQLAFTGSDPAPWLWLGGSLALTGALLLVADVRLRRRPRRTPSEH